MVKYVYWLKEIYKKDRAAVGGKAVNLGDMSRGLDVPPGFCLSSAAYHNNLEHYGLNVTIADKLAGLNTEDITAVAEVSAQIGELITQMPFLPEVEEAITMAFGRLSETNPAVKVAVRSSATAEDLADASFAGQQETFLDVQGTADVLLNVKECWGSLWTPRAIHYRAKKGFEHEQVKMAVIVQEMIPAAISGVMFTANPVNDCRDEIRIETVRGLGEQLVSGNVTGDIYILRKNNVNVEIIEKIISDPALGQMLTDYELRELAHTGLKVEIYYEDFQDIEWAYLGGKFYFLQTRSITTLGEEALPDIDAKKMTKMQREVMEWVAERFPEPIYPIDGAIVKLLFMAQFEAMQGFGYAIAEMDWTRVDRGIFPEFFTPPDMSVGLKRFMPYLRLGKTLKVDPAREWASEQAYLLDMLKKLKGRNISGLPFEIVLDYVTEALSHFHFFIVMRYNYFIQNQIPSAILMKSLSVVFKTKATSIYENLLAGSDNVTLVINKALHALANKARSCPDVNSLILNFPPNEIMEKLSGVSGGDIFLTSLNEFLDLYGERETTMGLGGIASPTWQDDPAVVFGIIRSMLSEDYGALQARETAIKQKAKAAEEQVYARLSRGLISLLPVKSLFAKVLRHSRSFAAFRENSHYDVTKCIHVFRILFTEVGQRFVRQGLLNKPEDIVYLTYFEIKEIILTIYNGLEEVNTKTLLKKIELRKIDQERRVARWQLRNVEYDETGAVKGIPASQGIVSGPVRIILDPHDFHRVKKGDILVAQYTNPAWTPLFTTAVGMVVETGGAASHAAIVAREYGIPAVMAVVKATELLKEGEIVTVNGNTGMIYHGQGQGFADGG